MTTRYRCGACGNLTRFDVTVTRTTRSFHHYSVGGALHVEDVQVIAEDVHGVDCRWCGHGRAVEVLDAEAAAAFDAAAADGDQAAGATGAG